MSCAVTRLIWLLHFSIWALLDDDGGAWGLLGSAALPATQQEAFTARAFIGGGVFRCEKRHQAPAGTGALLKYFGGTSQWTPSIQNFMSMNPAASFWSWHFTRSALRP